MSGDRDVQVGLNISLRYIFKPSYAPHCINTNVGSNSLPGGQVHAESVGWTECRWGRVGKKANIASGKAYHFALSKFLIHSASTQNANFLIRDTRFSCPLGSAGQATCCQQCAYAIAGARCCVVVLVS